MTREDVKTMLSAVPGFEQKTAYRSFPEAAVPQLPFLTFIDTEGLAFRADNVNYWTLPGYEVTLWEKYRDAATELALEAKLTAAGLTFTRSVDYDTTEKCWAVSYSFITKGD